MVRAMIAESQQAYESLTPDQILDAVESVDLRCDGYLQVLNSYENRVYMVGVDDTEPVVAKFYRPQRWSDAAIIEEHQFTLELEAQEIPVVAPLVIAGESLFYHGPFRFALYPRRGGRAPELEDAEHLEILGRFVARIHLLGETQPFKHRPTLSIDSFLTDSAHYLLEHEFIPTALNESYHTTVDGIERIVRLRFDEVGALESLRLHCDCHPGNILFRDQTPHIVDFDDARNGPAIQDLWMFVTGDRGERIRRLADVLEGYTQFREFDARELVLIESLRAMRMIHYAAWLARRWDDPAFPRAFPWFNEPRFWEEHILSLREQLAEMQEPALIWD